MMAEDTGLQPEIREQDALFNRTHWQGVYGGLSHAPTELENAVKQAEAYDRTDPWEVLDRSLQLYKIEKNAKEHLDDLTQRHINADIALDKVADEVKAAVREQGNGAELRSLLAITDADYSKMATNATTERHIRMALCHENAAVLGISSTVREKVLADLVATDELFITASKQRQLTGDLKRQMQTRLGRARGKIENDLKLHRRKNPALMQKLER